MVSILSHIISFIVFAYVAVSTLYLLIFAVAGRFGSIKQYHSNPCKKKVAVLIPCYKEDLIILDTVQRALAHNYPRDSFLVVAVADSMQAETVTALSKTAAVVLEVTFGNSTKARSLHAALALLDEAYEIVVILDADNNMADGCLEKINDAFHKGCRAVQCHRTAKNTHHPVSLLEAVSEEINVNLFRKGQAVLGLSAAPAGSGMAFGHKLLKEIFAQPRILEAPAEDREIDIQLMLRAIPMEFIEDAYILDEKVSDVRVFEKQRIRWFEAQAGHVRRLLRLKADGIPKTLSYWNQLFRNLLLPRLFYLAIAAMAAALIVLQRLVDAGLLYPAGAWWAGWIILYVAVLFISIPPRFLNTALLKAAFYVPVLMLAALRSLSGMKKERKEFIHTSKSYTSEE